MRNTKNNKVKNSGRQNRRGNSQSEKTRSTKDVKAKAQSNKSTRNKTKSKVPNTVNKNKNVQPNKKARTDNSTKHKMVYRVMSEYFSLKVPYLGDDKVVNSIVNLYESRNKGKDDKKAYVLPVVLENRAYSNKIKLIRTIASVGAKIKSGNTIKTNDSIVKEFMDTQREPVLSPIIMKSVRKVLLTYVKDFDIQETLAMIGREDRVKIITQGSSYPQELAPQYDDNKRLLSVAKHGDLYLDTFADARIEHIESMESDGKVTLVPKNYKTKRMITLTNRTILEKHHVISRELIKSIEKRSLYSLERNLKYSHVIQFTRQDVQHKLLGIKGASTIDASSASDRIYIKLLESVWPEFLEAFDDFLPKQIITDDRLGLSPALTNKKIDLCCIGTQGFPLTFTVMALIMGAVTRAARIATKSDPDRVSSNYGDDIIIPEEDFGEVYTWLRSCGLVINEAKSYKAKSGFVESCGKDLMIVATNESESDQDSKHITADVTPIYLRGNSDVDIINFVRQCVETGTITSSDGLFLLNKLVDKFYAFHYEFPITPFHFNLVAEDHLFYAKGFKPKQRFDKALQLTTIQVPTILENIQSIKGLNSGESDFVLELIKFNDDIKTFGVLHFLPNGSVVDYTSHELYKHYKVLKEYRCDMQEASSNGVSVESSIKVGSYIDHLYHDATASTRRLKDKRVTIKSFAYAKFIIDEYQRYSLGVYADPFDWWELETNALSFQELVNEYLDIKPPKKYPIYRILKKFGLQWIPINGELLSK
jgi:hypothetical protein